ARRRISACEDRSATRYSTAGLPVARRIASAVLSQRSRLRPTRTTVAPRRASSRAVTSPMPAVAPVTRQVLPAIDWSCSAMRCSLIVLGDAADSVPAYRAKRRRGGQHRPPVKHLLTYRQEKAHDEGVGGALPALVRVRTRRPRQGA